MGGGLQMGERAERNLSRVKIETKKTPRVYKEDCRSLYMRPQIKALKWQETFVLR